jgi:Fic family protein
MTESAAGQNWLMARFKLECPPPAVLSYCGQTARRTYIEDGQTVERYPATYMPADNAIAHLQFALKNEPLDMGVLAATFAAIDPDDIVAWVVEKPNSAYSRRAWFMYEWFTGKTLDLPNVGAVGYVKALDPDLNLGAAGRNSQRHRVIDNMFGVPGMCLTVRPTKLLADYTATDITGQARDLMKDCDPSVLARAINYLFTKETKSSFEIEREEPTEKKAERFVNALRNTSAFDPSDKRELVGLQNMIVDDRYAAADFRDFQNFVGQTIGPNYEKVHFVCPKPEDLGDLMDNWSKMAERMRGAGDPVAVAAAIAFSFVFLHPFEDGNGRIHRFLIHHVLAREGFTPPDILFPISAAIVRDERGYERALETFSRPIADFIDFGWTENRQITVRNQTSQLYRYYDATPLVEFLYQKVEETVHKDLKEELEFVAVFDAAYASVREIVDMPNRKASLFISLCLQNNGNLSKRKRALFAELSDAEVTSLEDAVKEAVAENRLAHQEPEAGTALAP